MIKHLNGLEISKKARKSECKVYVKSFQGAKTSCMKDYVKQEAHQTIFYYKLEQMTLVPIKLQKSLQKRLWTLQFNQRITKMTLVFLILFSEQITQN